MTKEEMRKELKFPILATTAFNMVGMSDDPQNHPSENSWIIVYCSLPKDRTFFGIYKWQKENNPTNIHGWCYINVEASTGTAKYVEYEHLSHDRIILLVDEKQSHLIIHDE